MNQKSGPMGIPFDSMKAGTALKDMIRDARITTKTWHEFLEDFVDDAELVARIKAKSPR